MGQPLTIVRASGNGPTIGSSGNGPTVGSSGNGPTVGPSGNGPTIGTSGNGPNWFFSIPIGPTIGLQVMDRLLVLQVMETVGAS